MAEPNGRVLEICRSGDLAAVKAVVPGHHSDRFRNKALNAVCFGGRLDVVKWFVEGFGVQQLRAAGHDCANTLGALCGGVSDFNGAPAEERVQTAQWLTDQFQLAEVVGTRARRSLLERVCASGQAELARWLVRVFGVGRADVIARNNAAFIGACASGNFELVRWLAEEFRLTPGNVRSGGNHAMHSACVAGHVEIARWINESFSLTADEVRDAIGVHSFGRGALEAAFDRGNIEMVRWLVDEVGLGVDDFRHLLFLVGDRDRDWMREEIRTGRRAIARHLVATFGFTEHDIAHNKWTAEEFAAEFGPGKAAPAAD
jgi:Ankyrin repeats (3 copies)